jgi:hypothetical protein
MQRSAMRERRIASTTIPDFATFISGPEPADLTKLIDIQLFKRTARTVHFVMASTATPRGTAYFYYQRRPPFFG